MDWKVHKDNLLDNKIGSQKVIKSVFSLSFNKYGYFLLFISISPLGFAFIFQELLPSLNFGYTTLNFPLVIFILIETSIGLSG